MKVIKIIMGLLAIALAVAHIITLPSFMEGFENLPSELHGSRWIGKGLGIFFGICFAFLCLKGIREK